MSFLTLADVSKVYGSTTVVSHLSLSVAKGEFVSLLGPSGCGKTTTLQMIAGFTEVSSGRIQLDGRDITDTPPNSRGLGIVFQSYALFPNLSVADNVAYGLVNRKTPRSEIKQRVTELLKLVGLPGSDAKFPGQLSGGQQQRIALARALATSPGLLLLDEPLSALDATVRVHLRNEIRALQRKLGVTTIMVTHDQEEALSVADRIVVMNHGVIEQVGTPMEVYREPASPFVASFVGKVNRIRAVAEGDHWFRCGDKRVQSLPGAESDFRPGRDVFLYMRPEDRVVGTVRLDDPLHCAGTVRHIEFLGGNCLAEVDVDGLPGQPLQVQYSLNQMDEFGVHEGAVVHFALRADRLRVFPTTCTA